jgi:hypothetical protein
MPMWLYVLSALDKCFSFNKLADSCKVIFFWNLNQYSARSGYFVPFNVYKVGSTDSRLAEVTMKGKYYMLCSNSKS